MTDSIKDAVYTYRFIVPESALDQLGHVNNVQYVAWMQEAAERHYERIGGVRLAEALGATWVVRSHKIEYLVPAHGGEEIEVCTWIANLRRVRSLRRYAFVRTIDKVLLVRGETEWVFIDLESGRPRAVPPEVAQVFPLLLD
jgi:acyl-CoA thioester hydrolase